MLSGLSVGQEMPQWAAVVQHLQRKVPNVVLSLGARGVMAADASGQIEYLAGHPVRVVNTIGAGDAFIGELAARMAEGMPLLSALLFANAAAALAVSQAASQCVQPDRMRIQELVAKTSPVIG